MNYDDVLTTFSDHKSVTTEDATIIRRTFITFQTSDFARVTEESARLLLLHNGTINVGGHVRAFFIKSLGLGIYELTLRQGGKTEMIP